MTGKKNKLACGRVRCRTRESEPRGMSYPESQIADFDPHLPELLLFCVSKRVRSSDILWKNAHLFLLVSILSPHFFVAFYSVKELDQI